MPATQRRSAAPRKSLVFVRTGGSPRGSGWLLGLRGLEQLVRLLRKTREGEFVNLERPAPHQVVDRRLRVRARDAREDGPGRNPCDLGRARLRLRLCVGRLGEGRERVLVRDGRLELLLL